MNTKRITSVTTHQTAEGMRATFTYSVIDADGNLIKSNVRHTIIVMDDTILGEIADVQDFLSSKIPE